MVQFLWFIGCRSYPDPGETVYLYFWNWSLREWSKFLPLCAIIYLATFLVAWLAIYEKEKGQYKLRPLLGVKSMRANHAGAITRKTVHTYYRNAHICAFAGCVVAFLMMSVTFHSSRVNADKLADLRAMQIDVRRIDGDAAYEYDFTSNCLVQRQIVRSDLGGWELLRTNTDELVVDSSEHVVVMGADDRIYCTNP